jgi:para-aminobenzoate synthetase / 4-amino-4-deoxychorismate lyase
VNSKVFELLALIRNDTNTGWLKFDQPVRVITAYTVAEVGPALAAIERASNDGYTAIGYLAYEAAPAFDPALKVHATDLPLLLFGLYVAGQDYELSPPVSNMPHLSAQISPADYGLQVDRVKHYLEQGDSYQVNLTHRLSAAFTGDAEALFAALFEQQPAPGSLFLCNQDLAICSVTPELFFALDGEQIRMEPMKGTRPRGSDPEHDALLRAELLNSDKERAENLMIVDLIRNDLGKIARPGSVQADALFELMELPTLWQQISRVSANTEASLQEIFGALFPCASVTGAPKKRTMEIIHELESTARGVYTGAVGVIRPGRQMHFGVAIRTLMIDRQRGVAEYSVGSGIVWDSETDSEWQETLMKAAIFVKPAAPLQLLESMRYIPALGVARLELHLHRLQQSAEYFSFPCDIAALRQHLLEFSAPEERKLRLLLAADGGFELQAQEAPPMEQAVRLKLARQAVASTEVYLQHKTTRREVYDQASAGQEDCDDVILWNERGEITETTIYNLYLQIDGSLLTPDLASGLLAGTYRQQLLEGGQVRAQLLHVDDLIRAEKIYVSNSVRGLCPATLIRESARGQEDSRPDPDPAATELPPVNS